MTPDERYEVDGSWLLVEIGGQPVDPGVPREIRFDGSQVSGRVGVNRFTGSYSLSEDGIEFGPAALTRMAGPPAMMDLESRFHQTLQGEHTVLVETRLVLGDMVLVRQSDQALEEE